MSNESQNSGIKSVDSPITVDGLKAHLSNPKKQQAQIRMIVTKTYPDGKAGNSLNDSIFTNDAFGFGEGSSFEDKRVTWIDVPAELTKAEVEAQLKKYPNARLYKVLSYDINDVLTEEQKSAMESGLSSKTLDDYKEALCVKNAETGEVIMHNGKEQYRTIGFSISGKEDVDLREKAPESVSIQMADGVVNNREEVVKQF